jgi:RHS repeat-associated protein
VQLDGRTQQVDFYRRGFNGMEKDDEVKGGGNSYTTEFRQYDPRLGCWLSLDLLSKKQPFLSPYTFVNNNPIFRIDPDGLEDFTINRKGHIKSVKGTENNEGPDKLIAGKAKYKNGELTNNSKNVLSVEKGILQNQHTIDDGHYFEIKDEKQADNLFKFVSKKTDVEFSLTKFEGKNNSFSTLSTTHNSGNETTASKLMYHYYYNIIPSSYPISISHNHPVYNDGNNIHVGSPKPSGVDLDQQKWVNDNFLKIMQNGDIERKIKFYIYKDTDGKFHKY